MHDSIFGPELGRGTSRPAYFSALGLNILLLLIPTTTSINIIEDIHRGEQYSRWGRHHQREMMVCTRTGTDMGTGITHRPTNRQRRAHIRPTSHPQRRPT